MNSTDPWLPILFWVLAALTVVPAVMILFVRDIVRCAFLLMASFMGIAGLFLLLGAEFLAFTLILIYVGGILILILFGVMLTQQNPVLVKRSRAVGLVVPGAISAAILLAGLVYVAFRVDWYTRPGEEERLHLHSIAVDGEGNETTLDDEHSLDGWLERAEDEKTLIVRDANGRLVARYQIEEGEDGASDRMMTRGLVRLDVVRLDREAGRPARDHRRRLLERRIYGRLEVRGKTLFVGDRHGKDTAAAFERRTVQLTPRGSAELLGVAEADLPDALLPYEGEEMVGVPLYVNTADEDEVVTIELVGEDDETGKHDYQIAEGWTVRPDATHLDEVVTAIGPALDETPVAIGKALMTDFLLPFEVASVLLLAALVGAAMIARRGGIEGV